jgi:hypothetical protein
MKVFLYYLKDFFRNLSLPAFITVLLVLSGLITLNYTLGVERRMIDLHPWYLSILAFYLFFAGIYFFSWGIQALFSKDAFPRTSSSFILLLLLAPLFFACKMVHWDLTAWVPAGAAFPWHRYTQMVLQLPAKLFLLLALIYVAWKSGLLTAEPTRFRGFWASIGLTTRQFNARPYFYLLLLLVPVVALASTRPDFLRYYPKVRAISFINEYTTTIVPWKLLYELSYGLDFLSIEIFFRGLLVVGLIRYAGEKAILPMAAFYCTVHFGKPLAECISSFFGGLVLGVLAWRTRSILGGLIVHLGLAWMMELGGWLGAAI